jgi:hypothetical protein
LVFAFGAYHARLHLHAAHERKVMLCDIHCRKSSLRPRVCPNFAAAIRDRGTTVSVAQSGAVKWYAIAVGRETGILSSWAEVNPLVTGFSGARHKRFHHYYQAVAWLDRITWRHDADAAATVSIVPAAGDLLGPPSQAPADEADALTREQAVASFMADGRDELSTKQRCAIEATFTASDTGSDSESPADTMPTGLHLSFPTAPFVVVVACVDLPLHHIWCFCPNSPSSLQLMLHLPRPSSATWFSRIGCSFSPSWWSHSCSSSTTSRGASAGPRRLRLLPVLPPLPALFALPRPG